MKFSLVVTQGSNEGKAIPIRTPEFVIGRDAKCNLRPSSQMVSKRHCTFTVRDGHLVLTDLKSTNGTFVNDEQVHGERVLKEGDRINVGPLDFLVRIEKEAQAEKPTHVEPATQAATPRKETARVAAPDENAEGLDDEAVGSLLLSMSDDEPGATSEMDELEAGSTVMKALKPEEMEQLVNKAEEKAAPYRPQTAKPASTANTSSAAKAILEKYRKRPKT